MSVAYKLLYGLKQIKGEGRLTDWDPLPMQSLFQINNPFLAVKSFFTETFKLLVPTVSIQRGKVNQGNKSSNLGCDSAMLKLQRSFQKEQEWHRGVCSLSSLPLTHCEGDSRLEYMIDSARCCTFPDQGGNSPSGVWCITSLYGVRVSLCS